MLFINPFSQIFTSLNNNLLEQCIRFIRKKRFPRFFALASFLEHEKTSPFVLIQKFCNIPDFSNFKKLWLLSLQEKKDIWKMIHGLWRQAYLVLKILALLFTNKYLLFLSAHYFSLGNSSLLHVRPSTTVPNSPDHKTTISQNKANPR